MLFNGASWIDFLEQQGLKQHLRIEIIPAETKLLQADGRRAWRTKPTFLLLSWPLPPDTFSFDSDLPSVFHLRFLPLIWIPPVEFPQGQSESRKTKLWMITLIFMAVLELWSACRRSLVITVEKVNPILFLSETRIWNLYLSPMMCHIKKKCFLWIYLCPDLNYVRSLLTLTCRSKF